MPVYLLLVWRNVENQHPKLWPPTCWPQSSSIPSTFNPGNLDFHAQVQKPLNYYTPDPDKVTSLPSSSTPSASTPSSSDPFIRSPNSSWNQWTQCTCWCNLEVCECSFCLSTPLMPPTVTLWSPRDKHLPSSNPYYTDSIPRPALNSWYSLSYSCTWIPPHMFYSVLFLNRQI